MSFACAFVLTAARCGRYALTLCLGCALGSRACSSQPAAGEPSTEAGRHRNLRLTRLPARDSAASSTPDLVPGSLRQVSFTETGAQKPEKSC